MSGGLLLTAALPAKTQLIVDDSDPQFFSDTNRELQVMRAGGRGLVCKEVVSRLDASSVDTHIKPVTQDEKTWHPNDRKGTRSHTVALDNKVRGAERRQPTPAIVFLHPSRVDRGISLFKLGTFVSELESAMDLNAGTFFGDYKVREKRAAFVRNAWRDSMGLGLISISDRVPTDEYQRAKQLGLINEKAAAFFPILDPEAIQGNLSAESVTISTHTQ